MSIFVLSDLHLDERAEARLFDDERQGKALASLCARVQRDPDGELILLGDTFDFTAMNPPLHGLQEFAKRVEEPLEQPPRRLLPELCQAVLRSNPAALQALGRLAEEGRLTLVPGNHDRHLAEPGAAAALGDIGLGRARLEPSVLRKLGSRTAVLQHGHEHDARNATPEGGGEAMTACMHHAVIPFLRKHGARRNVRMNPDRIVALRPEESVVSVLQRWLDRHTFERFFRAYLELLADNGYLPRATAFLARIASPNRIRKAVEDADRLWERTGLRALEALRGERELPHAAPPPDVLVFGHTHVLDWAVEGPRDEKLYVNLGTWTERATDASGPLDTTLPLLTLDDSGAALTDLTSGQELQSFSVAH